MRDLRPVPLALSNISSLAFDALHSGLMGSGILSYILLYILNKLVDASSLCATIPACALRLVATFLSIIADVKVLKPICLAFKTIIRMGLSSISFMALYNFICGLFSLNGTVLRSLFVICMKF